VFPAAAPGSLTFGTGRARPRLGRENENGGLPQQLSQLAYLPPLLCVAGCCTEEEGQTTEGLDSGPLDRFTLLLKRNATLHVSVEVDSESCPHYRNSHVDIT
jgi:hypothetical protein